ncbi:uncharacterized protein [Diadema antillarum]|uniref:uncharacterized protein n=1 Tax=Diadema antillarum TaxID=105358 RepID=UPI003A8A13A3
MTVTFNIAPFSYRFTYYVVSLYENGGSARPLSTKSAVVGEPEFIVFEINMDGLRMNATNVTFELDNYLGKAVFAEILPRCESNLDCATVAVQSDVIMMLENPCDSTPCGSNGSCTPMEAIYNCECDPTFIFDGSKCIDHPCKFNPCKDLGVCSLDGLDYSCDCNDSAINTGKTCIPNPCQPNPCDPYSTCEIDEVTFQHHCSRQVPNQGIPGEPLPDCGGVSY